MGSNEVNGVLRLVCKGHFVHSLDNFIVVNSSCNKV